MTGDLAADERHLLLLAVQVGARDLVDPELVQAPATSRAPVGAPGDREVVDELAGQVRGVLGVEERWPS